jgi:hypothetical protein
MEILFLYLVAMKFVSSFSNGRRTAYRLTTYVELVMNRYPVGILSEDRTDDDIRTKRVHKEGWGRLHACSK